MLAESISIDEELWNKQIYGIIYLMLQQFTLAQEKSTIDTATHFGVSVDNYANSLGDLGVTGFEIAQSGLLLVGRTPIGRKMCIGPEQLFRGVYDESGVEGSKLDEGEAPKRAYNFPDSVIDFSKNRNVQPITVIRMGAKLLVAANILKAGIGVDIPLHRAKIGGQIGKIDSKLSFRISPINTIVASQKPAGWFSR
jgi:hypothetical protein